MKRVFGKINQTYARKVITLVVRLFAAMWPEGSTAKNSIDFGKPRTLNMLRAPWQEAFRSKLLTPNHLFVSRAEMGLINLLYALNEVLQRV